MSESIGDQAPDDRIAGAEKSLCANPARRSFLTSSLRWLAFAALGGVSWLALRGRLSGTGEPLQGSCSGRGVCPSCPEFSGCGLAQARAVRRGRGGKEVSAGKR